MKYTCKNINYYYYKKKINNIGFVNIFKTKVTSKIQHFNQHTSDTNDF